MSTPTREPNIAQESPRDAPAASSGWLSGTNSMFGDQAPVTVRRAAGATAGSIAAHAALIALFLFLVSRTSERVVEEPPPRPTATLVYLDQPGPGGGGGGSPAPAPERPVAIPRTEPPPPAPVVQTPPPPVVPPPPPTLIAPVMTVDASIPQASGTSASLLSAPERGGGGQGTGLGTGTGSGVGEGTGGGFGGGAYRPGAGITNPTPLVRTKPEYTSEAMLAKIQGDVVLEAVVLEDGTIGDVRVVRSLDRAYGLDTQAIKAAKQWVFRPARDREGRAVAMVVVLEVGFSLH